MLPRSAGPTKSQVEVVYGEQCELNVFELCLFLAWYVWQHVLDSSCGIRDSEHLCLVVVAVVGSDGLAPVYASAQIGPDEVTIRPGTSQSLRKLFGYQLDRSLNRSCPWLGNVDGA